MGLKTMQQENINIKGIVKIRKYKKGTFEKVVPLLKAGKKVQALKILRKNQLEAEMVFENLIMQAANIGKDLIIQALNGYSVSPVYGLSINYGAIGTSNTTPTTADVKLGTEVARTLVSFSQDVSYNQLQLQFFFADALLPNQTYYEFGAFIGGTSAADSGKIFDHALFATPYVKTTGVDTTIELDIILT